MAMRQDCKHFESQTLSSGETLSKCVLNLAPQAPWNCPSDCPRYERRRVNVNLKYQNLAQSVTEEAPSSIEEEDSTIADLMADVENIVNEAAPEIVREVEEKKRKKGWRKVLRKRTKGKKRKRKKS